VTLATLAIHAESWLQEELAAQRSILDVLARLENAARAGKGAELAESGRALEGCLSGVAPRETRRAALLAKLGSSLGLASREVTLSTLCARLVEHGLDTKRIEALRGELRDTVTAVSHASRRTAALAQYHRNFFEELCQLLSAGSPSEQGHLVDARA